MLQWSPTMAFNIPESDLGPSTVASMLAAEPLSESSRIILQSLGLADSHSNIDSRMHLLVELYTNCIQIAKAMQFNAAKASQLLLLVRDLLVECQQAGWPVSAVVNRIWEKLLSAHKDQSTASRSSSSLGSDAPGTARTDDGSAFDAGSMAASDNVFRASEARGITEWLLSHGLLRHWDMYRHAFTKDRAVKSVVLKLTVDTPMCTPPLEYAQLAQ